MAALIEFQNVTVKEQQNTILKNVTFSVSKGDKVVIYGKSGSGKTTILTTLLGGHKPLEGVVKYNGIILNRESIHKIRTSIAFIGQEPILGEGTVENVLLFPFNFRANYPNKPDKNALIESLEKAGLSQSLLNSNVSGISGGEKQRIAIARALLLNKNVFCIDEATSALDSQSAELIVSVFQNKEFTVLSVSHDPRWFNIASRFIKIDNGQIIDDTDDRTKVKM